MGHSWIQSFWDTAIKILCMEIYLFTFSKINTSQTGMPGNYACNNMFVAGSGAQVASTWCASSSPAVTRSLKDSQELFRGRPNSRKNRLSFIFQIPAPQWVTAFHPGSTETTGKDFCAYLLGSCHAETHSCFVGSLGPDTVLSLAGSSHQGQRLQLHQIQAAEKIEQFKCIRIFGRLTHWLPLSKTIRWKLLCRY